MTETRPVPAVPDSRLAAEAADLAQSAESDLLLGHSWRAHLFALLRAQALGVAADPELLFVGAMAHDLGLTAAHRRPGRRFELVGADLAADLLRSHGRSRADAWAVWLGIALPALPELPDRIPPESVLLVAGVEADVLGTGLDGLPPAEIAAVLRSHPRPALTRLMAEPTWPGHGGPDPARPVLDPEVLAHLQPGMAARRPRQSDAQRVPHGPVPVGARRSA